jgi:hypothetical protein
MSKGENMVERPTKAEIELTLATTFRKWGGWPAVESGMINMSGVMAQAVLDLYADCATGFLRTASQPNEEGEGK